MKRFLLLRILIFVLIMALLPMQAFAAEDAQDTFYFDVTEDMWSYSYIKDLYDADIFPVRDRLNPYRVETRADFVSYLYALELSLGGKAAMGNLSPFEDVSPDHPHLLAIRWAKMHHIVNGVSETSFLPDAPITREEICAILIRYVNYAKIPLKKQYETEQFRDSLNISSYARTPVVACQMSGIVYGYSNGLFRPEANISREECAAVVWRMWQHGNGKTSSGELVLTSEGAYDGLYDYFEAPPDPTVPAGEEVDLSYFDRVAIVGDSVSQRLQYYCAATGALGNATFLCAQSFSAANALMPVSGGSVHPSYQGEKMLVEDAVQVSGDDIVYIMLGINGISSGIDHASSQLVTLVERILAKSPDVTIMIESVTPMAKTSTIFSNRLNKQITGYNNRMKEICEERGWYFINLAECMTDEEGYLIESYCSDNYSMGIHLNNDAALIWINYLKTHVPAAVLEDN